MSSGLRHVVLLSWRDVTNPEGGGAERYLHQMARGLVASGASVTLFSAAYPGARAAETIDGIRHVRAGSKATVYLYGLLYLVLGRLGRPDVVVDVQNGMPFLARLATRAPVVVLVHHVHREQWPVVYPGLSGRVGWWIESRLAPRVFRRCRYVAVSNATREELVELGVDAARISVVHNGTEPVIGVPVGRSPQPTVCVVGRLVPHKQVEHAIDAVAALSADIPGLRLRIVGSGWWQDELAAYAAERGALDRVVFEGQADERHKNEVYAESWVMALPSLKEGWGLVVGEAGAHGVPTVAYAAAGGTRESIEDGVSGLLVDDYPGFVAALRLLLTDGELRGRLGDGAKAMGDRYSWSSAQAGFVGVLERAAGR